MHQLTNKIIKDVWVDGMPIHRAKEVDGVVREWLEDKVAKLQCVEKIKTWTGIGSSEDVKQYVVRDEESIRQTLGLTPDPVEELTEIFKQQFKQHYDDIERHCAKEAIRWMEEKEWVVK